jgi:hypothetical protein
MLEEKYNFRIIFNISNINDSNLLLIDDELWFMLSINEKEMYKNNKNIFINMKNFLNN